MMLSLRGERKWGLLVINFTLIFLGAAAPLLLRLYFLKGGELLWLSSLVQVGGWPLLLIPSIISFFHGGAATPTFSLAAASAGIGVLTGLDSYMYSLSSSLLPVTINSILSSTQLAFVAVFSFLIVRQKLTSYSVNAIVVLTLGAVVLGDRPAGETKNKYGVGMAMSIGSAALYALTLPLTELVYRRVKGQVTYALVVKIQLVVSSFASAVCLVGMLLNGDLEKVEREAGKSEMGKTNFYLVLVGGAAAWQAFSLGLMGTIACSSSLFAGVVVALLLPISELAAVFLFNEQFNVHKGVAMALSLWGFASYCFGERALNKQSLLRRTSVLELPQTI